MTSLSIIWANSLKSKCKISTPAKCIGTLNNEASLHYKTTQKYSVASDSRTRLLPSLYVGHKTENLKTLRRGLSKVTVETACITKCLPLFHSSEKESNCTVSISNCFTRLDGQNPYTNNNLKEILMNVTVGKYQSKKLLSQKYYGFSVIRSCYTDTSHCLQLNSSLFSNRLHDNFYKCSNYFHTCNRSSINSSDVPDYLEGLISEVDYFEDEEDFDNAETEMEEEIAEFLTCRAVYYDETDSSFIMQCPSCSAEHEPKQSRDIFVDKHSGYYVCPWCCSAGDWEELCHLLDLWQDSLSEGQLSAVLEAAQPITETNYAENSLLSKYFTLATLRRYGCLLSSDDSRLIVPVYRPSSGALHTVGYHCVLLLHAELQVVSRFLTGQSTSWSSLNVVNNDDKTVSRSQSPSPLVAVSHICDALHLAQHGIDAIAVPCGNTQDDQCNGSTLYEKWGVVPSTKEVVVWPLRGTTLPYLFFIYVGKCNINCSVISPAGNVPLYHLTKNQLLTTIEGTSKTFASEKISSYYNLHDKLQHYITHKREACGVPWVRFTGLQSMLLGHRPGEVTVLSGSTGSGKTTLMAEYSLDLALQGVVTLWASLEISIVRLCVVLMQQYSGAPLPSDNKLFSTLAHNFETVPLYFLDEHGQQDLDKFMKVLVNAVVTRGVQHVIVDNLQFMVGCQQRPTEGWVQQDRAMAAFRAFATQQNCHVTLIVHPRKLQPDEHLTIQSIGGGARVGQEADNVLLLQVTSGATQAACRKAIQVVKNRYGGHLGVIPISFHEPSLTFSNWFKRSKEEKARHKKSNTGSKTQLNK